MFAGWEQKEVLIRLADAGLSFIYKVIGDDGAEDEGEVEPVAETADEYWGGSEAMD